MKVYHIPQTDAMKKTKAEGSYVNSTELILAEPARDDMPNMGPKDEAKVHM